MKKKRKMIGSLVAAMLLLNCLGTVSSSAAEPDTDCSEDSTQIGTVIAPGSDEPLNSIPRSSGHWVEINGGWKYQYDNGTFATSVWEYINGKWYHFDSDGWMQTGWLLDDGKWYYLGDNGIMVTGWKEINNKRYYFKSNGVMTVGWYKINNNWYYFKSTGAMATGWQEVNNKWYYLGTDGVMVTGWQEINNKWYYFESDGAMVTGWKKIENDWFYFNTNGVMATGWREISNYVGTYWYYFRTGGQMVTGWHSILGDTYYFNSDGQLQETTRRAVIVGNTDHSSQDVTAWSRCLSHLSFKGNLITPIESLNNPNYTTLYNTIDSVLRNAKEGDITYLCITCHGYDDGRIALCTDCDLTGEELHELLKPYKGKIVLFLNCCYAGLIINRTDSGCQKIDSRSHEKAFLSAFMDETRSGDFIDSKYIVLCSSSYDESSQGFEDILYNPHIHSAYANMYWMLGGGWDLLNNMQVSLFADANQNSIVTLNELYLYSYNSIQNDPTAFNHQNIVVYPSDSAFTIFARTNAN